MSLPILYSYWRSSASYRVRIALALKGIAYENHPISLINDEQKSTAYLAQNPQGFVPTFITATGEILTQSIAIIEYLEEIQPHPALLPTKAGKAAHCRAIAQIIACDIHPLNNLRVLKKLTRELCISDTAKNEWYAHWIYQGFTAIEALLPTILTDGPMSMGDTPGYLECFLIPQIYNAKRFNLDLSPYPILTQLYTVALNHSAIQAAHPDKQSDCPPK
ncbi:maleylacetoacetate isomerase [Suttonella ornithocola]|uniref:Stringent starvation protein A homolog n=1 Tax=Suttonella ornithocola TaxID=279832 RepID=A0A380MPC6_9GAMM|nr:maleylacetoacetate isomerase [Suttonella ornithocola]SUO94172.1 Stringent starvation protein A homolog [Suttonella ornithocola]